MTTKEQRETFEKAIDDNPTDPGAHFIYSDWLEEQGFDLEAQRERWLGKLTRKPYDPALRWKYGRWLSDQGWKIEADLNLWMVLVQKGKTDLGLVFNRRGQVNQKEPWRTTEQWPEEVREECQRRAKKLFEGHPRALFLVIGDGPPDDNGLSSMGTSRVSGVVRDPVLYYDHSGDLLYQVEKVLDIEIGCLCPFCGWDRMEAYGADCPHFVTEITEWPDTYGGTEGGTFGEIQRELLGPLVVALESVVSFDPRERNEVLSKLPDRLHPIIGALIEGDEPHYEPDIEGDPVKGALSEYLDEIFKETPLEWEVTSYDTEDHYGTWATLYWSSNARKTAREMARMVAKDLKQLRKETPTARRRSK
jgi:uncharacterized protein (TIGR02996 family)